MSSFVSTKHEIECEKLSRNNPFALQKKIEMCYYISFVDNNRKIHNTHMRLVCIHKGNNLFLPSTFPEEKASNVCRCLLVVHVQGYIFEIYFLVGRNCNTGYFYCHLNLCSWGKNIQGFHWSHRVNSMEIRFVSIPKYY